MLIVKMRKLTREEIQKAIKDPKWQETRISMKGKTIQEKGRILVDWFKKAKDKKQAEVQIINYWNALKRGGLVK